MLHQMSHHSQVSLEFSPEQAQVFSQLLTQQRAIVNGYSGTGKTLLLIETARRLSLMGQKILLVTFNRLLASQLEKTLKGVATVMTYTQMRQAIAKRRGVTTNNPSELDRVMKEALTEWQTIGPPKYNALLIDEAQSFRPEWLQLLIDYYSDARIYAVHDEAQILERRYTKQEELEELLGCESYQLSINFRSPRAVFERLMQIEDSSRETRSLRPPSPRSLREYLIDSRNLLGEVTARLDELAKEGIKPEEIVILGEADRLRRTGVASRVSALQNIPGFRGCEAKVLIIIWFGFLLDSAQLRSAYARASKITIVLFSESALHGGAETRLGQALLADTNCKHLHAALRTERLSHSRYSETEVEEFVETKLRGAASCVIQDGVWLGWLSEGAWMLDRERSCDGVALRLWKDALLEETKRPVYELKSGRHWALYLPAQENNKASVSLTWVNFNQLPCDSCGTTEALRLPLPNGKSCCALCWPRQELVEAPLAGQIRQWANELLLDPLTNQTSLPLSLHALAHWRHSPASPSINNHLYDGVTAVQAACRVWLLAVLSHLPAGHILTVTDARRWLQWTTPNQHYWRNYIGIMLNGISQRTSYPEQQWVERVKKGTFQRTEAHPALLVKRKREEYSSEEAKLWARFFGNLEEPAIYDSSFDDETEAEAEAEAVESFYLPRLGYELVIVKEEEMTPDMLSESLDRTLYIHGIPGTHTGWRVDEGSAWDWEIQHGLLAIGAPGNATAPRLSLAYQAARAVTLDED